MLEFQKQCKVYAKISYIVNSEVWSRDKIVRSNTSHYMFSGLNWIQMVSFCYIWKGDKERLLTTPEHHFNQIIPMPVR